jgi:hypothetical protein
MKPTINTLTPFLLFRTSRAYATLNMGLSDQFRVSPFENEFTEDGAAGAEASANLLDRRSDGYQWSEERAGFPDAERSTDNEHRYCTKRRHSVYSAKDTLCVQTGRSRKRSTNSKALCSCLRTSIIILALCLANRVLFAQNSDMWGSLKPGKYPVGFRVLEKYDTSRRWRNECKGRPIQISIWYPAASGGKAPPLTYRDYFLISARELDFADKAAIRACGSVRNRTPA